MTPFCLLAYFVKNDHLTRMALSQPNTSSKTPMGAVLGARGRKGRGQVVPVATESSLRDSGGTMARPDRYARRSGRRRRSGQKMTLATNTVTRDDVPSEVLTALEGRLERHEGRSLSD